MKRRITALFLLIAFVMLVGGLHVCTEEACPVCAAQAQLRCALPVAAAFARLCGVAALLGTFLHAVRGVFCIRTLTALKVKLSD